MGPPAARWPYVWRWALVNWLVFAVHPAQARPLRRLRPRHWGLFIATGLILGVLDERLAADSPARRAWTAVGRWLGVDELGVAPEPHEGAGRLSEGGSE